MPLSDVLFRKSFTRSMTDLVGWQVNRLWVLHHLELGGIHWRNEMQHVFVWITQTETIHCILWRPSPANDNWRSQVLYKKILILSVKAEIHKLNRCIETFFPPPLHWVEQTVEGIHRTCNLLLPLHYDTDRRNVWSILSAPLANTHKRGASSAFYHLQTSAWDRPLCCIIQAGLQLGISGPQTARAPPPPPQPYTSSYLAPYQTPWN